MDYEDMVSSYVGDCGPFQILVLIMVSLSSLMGGEFITHNFIGGTQEHWCHVAALEDVPHYQQK